MMSVHQVAKTIQAVNAADPGRFVYAVRVSAVQLQSLEGEVFEYAGQRPHPHCPGCKCDRTVRVCGVPVAAVPEFALDVVHFATKPRSAR